MTMKVQTDAIGLTTLILVLASYSVFALTFFFQKKQPRVEETRKASAAKWGIALQTIGFWLVWFVHRAMWWPFPASVTGEIILAALSVVLAFGSNWWCWRSMQALGKQWTFQARLIREHDLITTGPYAVVRNPIYLGMFGLMLSTGLALSTWWARLGAVIFFLIGNQIRIRAEEALLREAFGPQFEDYASRVPAFFPRIP